MWVDFMMGLFVGYAAAEVIDVLRGFLRSWIAGRGQDGGGK